MLIVQYLSSTPGTMCDIDDQLGKANGCGPGLTKEGGYFFEKVGVINIVCRDEEGTYVEDLYLALTPGGELWLRMHLPEGAKIFYEGKDEPCSP